MNEPAFSIEAAQKTRRGSQATPRQAAHRDEELWALVPVKTLARAKGRLGDCLGANREGLAVAMLKDVLTALGESEKVAQVVVVTADPQVAVIARQSGALVVEENGSIGMNAAIAQGVGAIRDKGVGRVVILPADIPFMTGVEFDRIAGEFDDGAQNEGHGCIGISPSADEGGTNCLFLDSRRAFTFRYGPDSYRLHLESAAKHGQRQISLYSPTISMDIDEPQDLEALLSFCLRNPEFKETETWKFLQSKGRTG